MKPINADVFEASSTVKATETTAMSTRNIYRSNPDKKRLTLALILFAIAIIGFMAITADAQPLSARPDRGLGGNGGQHSTGIDSVNLQSGSLNLSIPLASVPPVAGGKLGYTLTASYNSKLWDVKRSELVAQTSEPGCQGRYTSEEVVPSPTGGWRIGAMYEIFYRDAHEDYNYLMADSEECYGYEFNHMAGNFFKPMLRLPDGSEHELRIAGSFPKYNALGTREHLKGYYQQSAGYPGYPTFSSPVRMYTIDGTYVNVVVNPPSSSIYSTIYLKDGTKIEDSSSGQRITDLNGNSVLVNNGVVEDEQTGREIKWSNSTYNSLPATKVEYQSVGGTWQSVWVVWGTTTAQGKLYLKTDWNPQGGELGGGSTCGAHAALPSAEFGVVRKIVFPNADPREYTFEYNSDTNQQVSTQNVLWSCVNGYPTETYTRNASPGLGELNKIVTPSGAEINYDYAHDGVHDFVWRSWTL